MNIQEALQQANTLATDSERLDAELLLSKVLGKSRTFLYAWPETPLSDKQHLEFDALMQRRQAGEPVAHIIGEREFWSLPLKVNASTLIPRPDTETLVEHAISHTKALQSRLGPREKLKVLDLGTGTGAIALALAKELPEVMLTATDKQADALALATENARSLEIENVRLLLSDWFDRVDESFHVVVSNPPYIDERDEHLHQGDLRFEPASALVSADQGLADIRRIVSDAPQYLHDKGWLLLEHGWEQGESVRYILHKAGFKHVKTHTDLGGQERVTEGCLCGE